MPLWTRLLRWYDAHGRDLPWRKTNDPYRILVSEIMLQQTQVSRGLLYYERWLDQFPDWNALAAASNADVIRAWAGLGYNRRALMLRDIAKQWVENSKKQEAKTPEDLIEFKGIGPYTASAIAAFAFKRRVLPIDTNVRRVLGRLLYGIPFPQPSADKRILRDTDRILPKRGRFYDVPQAIFDLASSHCAKVPSCATCPMRSACPASSKFLSGRVRIPNQSVKKATETKHRNKKFPDRIYRGRILKLVRESGAVKIVNIGPNVDPSYDDDLDRTWIRGMLDRMQRDGMLRFSDDTIELA